MDTLKEECENLEDDLRDYLGTEIVDFHANPNDLTSFVTKYKKCAKLFEASSLSLSKRLSKDGAMHESSATQVTWTKLSNQMSVFDKNLNTMLIELGLDTLSKYETSSIQSRLSLRSNLAEEFQSPLQNLSSKSYYSTNQDVDEMVSIANNPSTNIPVTICATQSDLGITNVSAVSSNVSMYNYAYENMLGSNMHASPIVSDSMYNCDIPLTSEIQANPIVSHYNVGDQPLGLKYTDKYTNNNPLLENDNSVPTTIQTHRGTTDHTVPFNYSDDKLPSSSYPKNFPWTYSHSTSIMSRPFIPNSEHANIPIYSTSNINLPLSRLYLNQPYEKLGSTRPLSSVPSHIGINHPASTFSTSSLPPHLHNHPIASFPSKSCTMPTYLNIPQANTNLPSLTIPDAQESYHPHSSRMPFLASSRTPVPPGFSPLTTNNAENLFPPTNGCGPSMDSHFSMFSNHMLENKIITKGIEPFNGTAYKFWPWVSKIQEYAKALNLNPLKTLLLWESYSIDGPQLMISRARSSMGNVTLADLRDVWQDLSERYGSSQQIKTELDQLIIDFPLIKGKNQGEQLLALLDICKIINFNKCSGRCPELAKMDLADGLRDIRSKMPIPVQHEWSKFGISYESRNIIGQHPPFEIFIDFLKKQARIRSNKNYEVVEHSLPTILKKSIRVLKTETLSSNESSESEPNLPPDSGRYCTYHAKRTSHNIFHCFDFKNLKSEDKINWLDDHKLCHKCTGKHNTSDCKSSVKCDHCQKDHASVLHRFTNKTFKQSTSSAAPEDQPSQRPDQPYRALCTKLHTDSMNKSCSKTVLVQLTLSSVPNKVLTAYAIIDEQANTTLVDESVLSFFGQEFPIQEFSLKFASQNCEFATSGKLVSGLQVRGIQEEEIIDIPEALSCPNISDTKNEIATPELVNNNPFISQFSKFFPPLNNEAQVLILIGRNCGRAMATECLTTIEPYVHRGPLGYSVVGNIGKPKTNKSHPRVLSTDVVLHQTPLVTYNFIKKLPSTEEFDTFAACVDDDYPGLSSDDRNFISIMNSNVKITSEGNIELPLPLKSKSLPDNRAAVYMRSQKTLLKLKSEPVKVNACIESMKKSLDAGYVEMISPKQQPPIPGFTWYLPIFCVKQEKKSKFRLVYDASAKYHGTSLNDALYQGPDFNNQLRSVLLRFR